MCRGLLSASHPCQATAVLRRLAVACPPPAPPCSLPQWLGGAASCCCHRRRSSSSSSSRAVLSECCWRPRWCLAWRWQAWEALAMVPPVAAAPPTPPAHALQPLLHKQRGSPRSNLPQRARMSQTTEPTQQRHRGGGGAGPHAPPPLHVPQDPCPARGSSRRGSRGWLLCCWRGTQARGSGGSTWQGAPGTSSIDGRGRASTERCCIPGEQAARNTRLHLCQRLVLLQTIPPPHTHSLLAVCSGRMIRRRTRWARNMRERRSEPAAVSSQQGARRSRRLSWIHQPPCSSSSSRSSSRSSSSPTWLQVVMLPSAARIPSSTGKAAASSTAQVCCGAVRCVATGWML